MNKNLNFSLCLCFSVTAIFFSSDYLFVGPVQFVCLCVHSICLCALLSPFFVFFSSISCLLWTLHVYLKILFAFLLHYGKHKNNTTCDYSWLGQTTVGSNYTYFLLLLKQYSQLYWNIEKLNILNPPKSMLKKSASLICHFTVSNMFCK